MKEKPKNNLRDLREKLGLSRTDVVMKMKKSIRCIERIENGEKKLTLEEAASLSKIYDVSLEYILLASRGITENI